MPRVILLAQLALGGMLFVSLLIAFASIGLLASTIVP
jgi:hypothetical protein